jgi:hypothetical protein
MASRNHCGERGSQGQKPQEQPMDHQQRGIIQLSENPTLKINQDPAASHETFFAAFLNALHESRRLQAVRIIRQHRHLMMAK